MTVDEKVKYWVDIADYDFETAEAMFRTKRWLYVGFMCHQVLEKMLKAYWCSKRMDEPPYIHNLLRLAVGTDLMKDLSEEQRVFLSEMIPMNIEARYPQYKEELSKTLVPDRCILILNQTKELQLWIKNRL